VKLSAAQHRYQTRRKLASLLRRAIREEQLRQLAISRALEPRTNWPLLRKIERALLRQVYEAK
jgi:hypothetical protein